MSRDVNKVILIGRLGQDPDVRYTKGGKAIANLSLATSRSFRKQDGEKSEKTNWHKIVCFDKLAEIVQSYAKKGHQLYVEGSIDYDQYKDKQGVERWTTEIRAFDIQILTSTSSASNSQRQPASQAGTQAPPQQSPQQSPAQKQAALDDDWDDDIPFLRADHSTPAIDHAAARMLRTSDDVLPPW